MYDTIESRAKQEIIKQLQEIDRTVGHSNSFGRYNHDMQRSNDAHMRFRALDSLLRSIYTPQAVAWVYVDAATTIMFENRGEVQLKTLIDKVNAYRKDGR